MGQRGQHKLSRGVMVCSNQPASGGGSGAPPGCGSVARETVGIRIRMTEIRRQSLRSVVSPMWPKVSTPTGREMKPTANEGVGGGDGCKGSRRGQKRGVSVSYTTVDKSESGGVVAQLPCRAADDHGRDSHRVDGDQDTQAAPPGVSYVGEDQRTHRTGDEANCAANQGRGGCERGGSTSSVGVRECVVTSQPLVCVCVGGGGQGSR